MALDSEVLLILVVGGVTCTCLFGVIGYLYWQISTLGTYLKVEQSRPRYVPNQNVLVNTVPVQNGPQSSEYDHPFSGFGSAETRPHKSVLNQAAQESLPFADVRKGDGHVASQLNGVPKAHPMAKATVLVPSPLTRPTNARPPPLPKSPLGLSQTMPSLPEPAFTFGEGNPGNYMNMEPATEVGFGNGPIYDSNQNTSTSNSGVFQFIARSEFANEKAERDVLWEELKSMEMAAPSSLGSFAAESVLASATGTSNNQSRTGSGAATPITAFLRRASLSAAPVLSGDQGLGEGIDLSELHNALGMSTTNTRANSPTEQQEPRSAMKKGSTPPGSATETTTTKVSFLGDASVSAVSLLPSPLHLADDADIRQQAVVEEGMGFNDASDFDSDSDGADSMADDDEEAEAANAAANEAQTVATAAATASAAAAAAAAAEEAKAEAALTAATAAQNAETAKLNQEQEKAAAAIAAEKSKIEKAAADKARREEEEQAYLATQAKRERERQQEAALAAAKIAEAERIAELERMAEEEAGRERERRAELEAAKEAELAYDRKLKAAMEQKKRDEAANKAIAEAARTEKKRIEAEEAAEIAAAAEAAAIAREAGIAAGKRQEADRVQREHAERMAAMSPMEQRLYLEQVEVKQREEEYKQRSQLFASADGDGDGMMSLEEARAQGMSEAMFRAIDADGNGFLTQDEFSEWQTRNR